LLDRVVFLWITSHRWSAFDRLMVGLSAIGRGGVIWLALALVLALARRLSVRGALTVALAIGLASSTANLAIKPLVRRERPFVRLPQVQLLDRAPHDASFPSGHSANAFAGAFALSRVASLSLAGWPVLCWLLAAAIAYSRVYVGVHYPVDVIGGALLGVACGALAVKAAGYRVWASGA
jgi:undecaprenyl-diphosphatase